MVVMDGESGDDGTGEPEWNEIAVMDKNECSQTEQTPTYAENQVE